MGNDIAMIAEQLPVAPLEALRRAVQKSSLAVGLLHLPRRRYLELSDRAKSLLGLGSIDLGYLDALTLSKEPDDTYRLFALTLDGALDGYRAQRRIRSGADEIECNICVRAVVRSPSREAVVLVSFADESERGGAEVLSARRIGEFVLTSVLEVVHPDDMWSVLEAFETAVTSAKHMAVPVRCGARRGWQNGRIVVSHLGDDGGFGLTVAPADDDQRLLDLDRVGELERRLRRIADEIEAAGLFQRVTRLPDPDRVPGLEALSSRQWEIVTRLLRGERVPRIARAMYLSPSTVRNHLSTIFRKLGVHSQAELIDRLHPPE